MQIILKLFNFRAARGLPKSAGQNAGSPNSTPASTRASSPASSDSGESKFHNKTKVISKESPQHTWSEKFGQSETVNTPLTLMEHLISYKVRNKHFRNFPNFLYVQS